MSENLRHLLEELIAQRNFSSRLEKTGQEDQDKVIDLVNELLAEIQSRGEKLLQSKLALKSQITVHAEELKKKNSELELSLREAQTASQSKSVFLANMSHELRTPLNAIIGYSEMLQDEAADEGHEGLVPDLQKIHDAGKDLLHWVDEILDLSKIESGRTELQIDSFTAKDLMEEIKTSVVPAMEKADNNLIIRWQDEVGLIKGDRSRIRLVLSALIDNASKATKKGNVFVEPQREIVDGIDWVNFAVTDYGAGIDSKLLQNLFKDYTQTDSAVSSAYGGTALGLAICHRFSLIMGGNISAESELGKGSTFTLRLPVDVKAHLSKTHVIRGTNRLIIDLLNLK